MNFINRSENQYPGYTKSLRILVGMIFILMGLGATVRLMGAGLACPDWPLCFGKIIPDYHFGVYLEWIHRVDAAIVSIDFFICAVYAFMRPMPKGVRWAAALGLIVLPLIGSMGAFTVLHQVREVFVTGHLLLATSLLGASYWMLLSLQKKVQRPIEMFPASLEFFAWVAPIGVFLQIAIGGLVASTFAGSVCLDWPLCNGQWVPTLSGPIGLQVIHRFMAYAIAAAILLTGLIIQVKSTAHWVTPQLLRVSRFMMFVVIMQIVLGVMNLKFMIPPYLAVPHQTVALLLFATTLHLYFVVRRARQSITF